jgi:hypothetical protein
MESPTPAARTQVGAAEEVRVDDLAEEAGIEGFTGERVEQEAGDGGREAGRDGPGGKLGLQIAGGERGYSR